MRSRLVLSILSRFRTPHLMNSVGNHHDRFAVILANFSSTYDIEKAYVVTMPSIESSYAAHTAKGIQGFSHPDWPALRVAIEVLNSLESYLWVSVKKVKNRNDDSSSNSAEIYTWLRTSVWGLD